MNKSNHTPGPWFWANEFETIDGRETWSLVGAGGFGILSCDGDANSPHRHYDNSNVSLIAAAPDMLKILEEIADSDMAMREEDEGEVSPLLEKVRAIISKATAA